MPDFIFSGGPILTMDFLRPRVEALAVRGGRILAAGDLEEIRALSRQDSEHIDLSGRALLPGFHDSHVHLGQHGLELKRLHLQDTPTLKQALAQVAARAKELPTGSWILGSGFALERWQLETISKTQLDDVAPNHPVFLLSRDHHSAWANSLALRLANVHSGSTAPKNGVIVREENGEPSGLLLEQAAQLIARVVPRPSDQEIAGALHEAGESLAGQGITTVHHMAYEPAAQWRQMALTASREDYPLRVWACIPQEDIEHAAALGLATGQGGSRFIVGGAKFFADGALGSLTAWMLKPYAGTSETGMAVHGPEVLAERLPLAINAGLTPVIHAIGDAANRAVLAALENSQPLWQARGLRPRIEHAQHLHPADLMSFARLKVIASLQPLHLVFDAPRIRKLLADRLSTAYAMRSLADSGAVLALGSDTPVASPDVRQGLLAACRRLGSDGEVLNAAQCLTVEEALAGYTSGAAYAIGRENSSGRLQAGFDADLVLLSHDPTEKLDGLQIEGTMLAGRWTKEPSP